MAASWMASSQTVAILLTLNKSNSGYFANFEQVKDLVAILLTLTKLKKLATKLSWEKPDAYASFLAMASCHRHSTVASQTCEGLHQV